MLRGDRLTDRQEVRLQSHIKSSNCKTPSTTKGIVLIIFSFKDLEVCTRINGKIVKNVMQIWRP